MKLDELYPNWHIVHTALIDAIFSSSIRELDARPTDQAQSIREMTLAFMYEERLYISHAIGQNAFERPDSEAYPDGHSLSEALIANRSVSSRVVAPLAMESLISVRRLPADLSLNRPETNMRISALIWHIVEREIYVLGRVMLRLEDMKPISKRPSMHLANSALSK